MKGALKILILFAATAVLCGCPGIHEGESESEFMASQMPCLHMNGKTVHEFKPETWQTGFNRSKRQFRVSNDTMSDFYVLECSAIPTREGQKITADLTWSAKRIVTRRDVSFSVKKMDSRGMVWLWNSKDRIGVSVMIPE